MRRALMSALFPLIVGSALLFSSGWLLSHIQLPSASGTFSPFALFMAGVVRSIMNTAGAAALAITVVVTALLGAFYCWDNSYEPIIKSSRPVPTLPNPHVPAVRFGPSPQRWAMLTNAPVSERGTAATAKLMGIRKRQQAKLNSAPTLGTTGATSIAPPIKPNLRLAEVSPPRPCNPGPYRRCIWKQPHMYNPGNNGCLYVK